jgi:hypothetical protein
VNLVSHSQARQLMREHFSLRISVERERSLRLHLQDCRACSARYDRHLLLAKLDPSAASAEQRLAAGLGFRARPEPRWLWLQAGLGAALVAACALLLLARRPAAELAGRGGAPLQAQVVVYRVAGQTATPVGQTMRRGDELAFAYANPAGFKKLMIFGVDEHGHVFWYHPGWATAADNPRAVDIVAGPQLHELTEAVAHELDGKRLKIHALFTNADLSVRDLESMLQRGTLAGDTDAGSHTLPDGSFDTEINLAVE